MPNGATPLGYGAAVLPKSTFDPNEFGQQVAAIEAGKVETKKENAKKRKEAALESMNPELGKLKWTSPFVNQYEKKIKDFRERNVQWYKIQDGKLSSEQIQSNKQFTNETKAEFELLNTVYDDFVKVKNNVFTNKLLNTPENLKEIERFGNPYKNDPKGLAEVDGDLLAYVDANPLLVKQKVDDIDIVSISKKVNDAAGTAQIRLEPYTDSLTGQIVYPEITSGRPERVAAMSEQLWRTTLAYREKYPDMEKFQSAVALGIPSDERTDKFVKAADDDKTVKKVGRARVSGGTKVTKGEGVLKVTEDKKSIIGGVKKVDRNLKRTTYAWSDSKNKPITISSVINNIGAITGSGLKSFPKSMLGRNIDFKVSSVDVFPTLNEDIDLSKLPKSIDRKLLMSRISDKNLFKTGTLKTGTILTEDEFRILNKFGLEKAIDEKAYAMGTVAGIEEGLNDDEKATFKKGYGGSYAVPYDDIKTQIKNAGLEIDLNKGRLSPETSQRGEDVDTEVKGAVFIATPQKKDSKGNLVEALVSKSGKVMVWDDEQGGYALKK